MMKNSKEPIGYELSVHASLVKEASDTKAGMKCKLIISATKLGEHTHEIGKNPDHMIDFRIDDIEYEYEEDKDEEEDEK